MSAVGVRAAAHCATDLTLRRYSARADGCGLPPKRSGRKVRGDAALGAVSGVAARAAVRYVGRDHLSLVADDSPFGADPLRWTQQRLAGEPAPSGCSDTTR